MRGVSVQLLAARAACVFSFATALGLSAAISVANAQDTTRVAPIPDTTRAAAPAVAERGIVSGRVLDRATGQPLPYTNVIIVGTTSAAQTDLDGRFRIVSPAGAHSVRANRLGFAMSQVNDVLVGAGANVTVNFSLGSATVQLQAVKVEGTSVRASSEDALLALQRTAPRVSDGISAEAIRRAPGSNAADAITRVTGVSILDKKFVVVRGLSERYSNTLLNGVELSSPEPLKKIVPLDMFPASLIESIVTSKTATPDRPADFAGGSVEVTTKEFPNERVVEGNMSFGYASEATFRRVAQPLLSGFGDNFGFDTERRRQMPQALPADTASMERFAEALPNYWTPAPRRVAPDLSGGLNLGGRFGGESAPFGYALAFTYGRQTDHTPSRLSQIILNKETGVAERGYIANETTSTVDLGGIVNLAARLGQSSKLGFKNLYTRNAEELLATNTGFETTITGGERRIYQARYVTRQMIQTQLTGDHLIGPLFGSRLEWKGTVSAAQRDEPENRSLIYFMSLQTGVFSQSSATPGPYWFRFLDDRLYSGQVDWSVPIHLRRSGDASLKIGAMRRKRDRAFKASFYRMGVERTADTTEATRLPPEQALAPENIGPIFQFAEVGAVALPYESDDDINAAYAMLDVPIFSSLRIVGGVRMEDWRLNLFEGTRQSPLTEPTRRQNRDKLWSGNLNWSLTDRQNIRLAAYQTVARPDPREVSPDYYVAVTGDCATQGNPELRRTRITNGDLRWEYFPNPGELISISVFYKKFRDPIVELLSLPTSSVCVFVYSNVTEARNQGLELEARRGLTFLPGFLNRLSLGLNLTLVKSVADYSPRDLGVIQLPLQGQSKYVANASLLYLDEPHGLEATLLFNAFGDRVLRYGAITIVNGAPATIPHLVEQGRSVLDAKIRKRLGRGLSASLSGRNLTDSEIIYVQDSDVGLVRAGYQRPGTTVTFGLGYAFR